MASQGIYKYVYIMKVGTHTVSGPQVPCGRVNLAIIENPQRGKKTNTGPFHFVNTPLKAFTNLLFSLLFNPHLLSIYDALGK